MATTTNEFSPLDQIRQAEAESTRRIAAAREAAERKITEARKEGNILINQAREAGKREGQAQYGELVAKADEEAKAIIEQARQRTIQAERSGEKRMDLAIRQVVNLVLGMDEGD